MIYIFGDSFSFGHNEDYSFGPYKEWRKYLKSDKLPEEWFVYLSKKLGITYSNHGFPGASNDQIFHKFVETSHKIRKGDIVIINWTYVHRFRWGTDDPKYRDGIIPMSSVFEYNWWTSRCFKKTRDQIVLNRDTYDLFKKDVYNYQNLISRIADYENYKVFFWDADGRILSSLSDFKKNPQYICSKQISNLKIKKDTELWYSDVAPIFKLIFSKGGKTIQGETNGKVLDNTHLGGSGHRIQGELFYNHIKKYI